MSFAEVTLSASAAGHAATPQPPCLECARRGHCLGGALVAEALHPPQVTRGVVPKGEHLFRAGDRADTIYLIRSGATKTYVVSSEGEEEVRGFQLANDTAGLEAVCSDHYHANAAALTRTWICKLPAAAVRERVTTSPSFRDRVFASLGREFERLHGMLHRERCAADRRVAGFLLGQLRRQGTELDDEIELPMSRADLGRYLGLATETVSRVFTRLQDRGMVRNHGARCHIVDRAALQALN